MWLCVSRGIVKIYFGSNPKLVFLISPERLKLEISNLVCALTIRSNYENMRKLGQSGRDPVYAIYILNLPTPVNISPMAKSIGFKFNT